jgi:hypothetical protein
MCLAAIGLISLIGCNSSNSGKADWNERPSLRPTEMKRSGGCIDTAGIESVDSGPVQAGPFASNHGHWTQPEGTKLWVASEQPQGNRGAVIQASFEDGEGRPLTFRRGPGERAELVGGAAKRLAEYYPGTIRLPESGTWRLTITIGDAVECFLVFV